MVQRFKTAQQLADHLRVIHRRNLKLCFYSILDMVGAEALKMARDRVIGRTTPLRAVYPFQAWQALKDATIERKAYKGWGKDGDPRTFLYATGQLAQSLQYRVEKNKLRVIMGTDDKVGLYQEYGTFRIPARPFLGPSMVLTVDRLYPSMERMFVRTLKGLRI